MSGKKEKIFVCAGNVETEMEVDEEELLDAEDEDFDSDEQTPNDGDEIDFEDEEDEDDLDHDGDDGGHSFDLSDFEGGEASGDGVNMDDIDVTETDEEDEEDADEEENDDDGDDGESEDEDAEFEDDEHGDLTSHEEVNVATDAADDPDKSDKADNVASEKPSEPEISSDGGDAPVESKDSKLDAVNAVDSSSNSKRVGAKLEQEHVDGRITKSDAKKTPKPAEVDVPPQAKALADKVPAAPNSAPRSKVKSQVPVQSGNLNVVLTFETGRQKITLGELWAMKSGYTFVCQNPVESPIEIRANDALIGYGQLVDVEGKFGVQVTEFIQDAE
jgi:flagellar motor switch/type III secretory pathway protein FliN